MQIAKADRKAGNSSHTTSDLIKLPFRMKCHYSQLKNTA
jgi:hypothetical protein